MEAKSGSNENEEEPVLGHTGGYLASKGKKGRVSKMGIVARAFVMTFVSEIGDRSQITTVVLAAHRNPWAVTIGMFSCFFLSFFYHFVCLGWIGAASGHVLCTWFAVMGGKLLSSRISEKKIALFGGVLFLGFGLETFIWGPLG